jgi:hypothetical protein
MEFLPFTEYTNNDEDPTEPGPLAAISPDVVCIDFVNRTT